MNADQETFYSFMQKTPKIFEDLLELVEWWKPLSVAVRLQKCTVHKNKILDLC